MKAGAAAALALPLAMVSAHAVTPPDPSLLLNKPQSDYLLGCGGCHGPEGHSNPRLVPDLRNQVGYFLLTEAGRAYLVRVPNVALYTASNEELAAMLNYMLFTLGGTGVPAGAKPYTAAEVAHLRKSPLTEVSLIDYRARIVEELISHHGAPDSLREYGTHRYAN